MVVVVQIMLHTKGIQLMEELLEGSLQCTSMKVYNIEFEFTYVEDYNTIVKGICKAITTIKPW